MSDVVLVVAGNYNEARNFARQEKISHRLFRYIFRYEQMKGYKDVSYALVGTWNLRYDDEMKRILQELDIMKALGRAREYTRKK